MIYNTCPACKFKTENGFDVCPKCGVIVKRYIEKSAERRQASIVNSTEQRINKKIQNESKYPNLVFVLFILKFLGIIPIALSLLSFFTKLPFMYSIACLVFSSVVTICFWASAESVQVFIDIEENQRKLIKINLEK